MAITNKYDICQISVVEGPDMSEFRRDLDAMNRLSNPRRANLMMLDLIHVRAWNEIANEGATDTAFTHDRIKARAQQLYNEAIAMGYPRVPIRFLRFVNMINT